MNAGRYLIKTVYQYDQLYAVSNKDFVRPTIVEQAEKSYDSRQRIGNPNFTRIPSGYNWRQANLHRGNVTVCYYNAQAKVIFNDP